MRILHTILIALIIGFIPIYGFATEDDFQKNFNIAKKHLSQREILKAIPYLEYLNQKYPSNANLQYLIGLCYAEKEIVHPKTLQLLEKASKRVSLEYNPNSLKEERVPIYVYYYLSIAYSQQHECDKAEEARNKFLKIYYHEDNYYIEESMLWLKRCKKMTKTPASDSLPTFPDFEPYTSKKIQKTKPKEQRINYSKNEPLPKSVAPKTPQKIITKSIEYTTDYPLYGVQLGAFHEVVPVSRFKALKNVDAFMDTTGVIRYVIGHFSYYSQAESLLKAIQSKGYEDAFIVDVNNARKFAEYVISVDNVNIKATLSGKLSYHIQVGAFKREIPSQTIEMYFDIEGLKERKEGVFTYLTVGDFKNYEEAKEYEKEVVRSGIRDAFVIARLNGKKISLQTAKDYK
ncbi:MAG: hypothetical protein CMO34_06290 [Verrucomicrobia bacterium]|nr:hypothetical protein [Verrucomicrobiota bacterium]